MGYVSIDGFVIDASVSEKHTHESDVSEYPTESGSNLTDHIRPKPIVVTIEGLVSDSPVAAIQIFRDGGATPSEAARAHLLRLFAARLPVAIVTALRAYDNMGMTSLEFDVAADKTGGLWFTSEFKEVLIIVNTRSNRAAVPRAQGKDSRSSDGKRVTLSHTTFWRKGAVPGGPDIYDSENIFYDDKTNTWFHFGNGASPPQEIGLGVYLGVYKEIDALMLDLARDRKLVEKQLGSINLKNLNKVPDPINLSGQIVHPDGTLGDRGGPPHIPRKFAGKGV